MKALKLVLILMIVAPMGAWAKMPKIDREDFSQLIVDGMKSSIVLGKEIRKNLGVAPERRENSEIRTAVNTKKIAIEVGAVDQVAAPTTKFVRAQNTSLDLDDQNERRLAEEFDSAGY